MAEVSNWIRQTNVAAFATVIAQLVDYDLSADELDAILLGVKDSDTEAAPQRWYEYECHGSCLAKFKIGLDQGTDVVLVRLEVPEQVSERAELVLSLMNQYSFVPGMVS